MSNLNEPKKEPEVLISPEILAKSFLSLTPLQRRELLENNTASTDQKAEVVKSVRAIQDKILEVRKEITFLYDNYETVFLEAGVRYSHLRLHVLDDLFGALEGMR